MHKPQIDGARAFCFMGVFLTHNSQSLAPYCGWGLPLFYLISGFLLTCLLIEADQSRKGRLVRRFYARRMLRTFPAYFAVLAVLAYQGNLPYWLHNLTFTYNIKIFDLSKTEPVGEVLGNWQKYGIHVWSINAEEQFYLLYPLLLLWAGAARRIRWLAAGIAGSILLRCYFVIKYPAQPNGVAPLFGALLPICGEYSLWGCLAAAMIYGQRDLLERRVGGRRLIAAGAAAFILTLALTDGNENYFLMGVFRPFWSQSFFGLALAVLVAGIWIGEGTLTVRFLSIRPIVWLGKLCYGAYLWHGFTWQITGNMLMAYPWLSAVPAPCIRFFFTVLLAAMSWYLLERPVYRLKKHFPILKHELERSGDI